MHLAGLARTDITVYEEGMALMGWGVPWCQAKGVGMPLHARALVVDDGEDRFAYVVVELLLVTQGLWLGVLDLLAQEHPALGLDARNVSIVATHTHSGPSGYGHHFWINLNAPGFSGVVYDSLVRGIVDAIVRAHAARVPSRLVLTSGDVPQEAGVAFNRSWQAYSRNPEVDAVSEARRDEAVHRTMTVLRVEDEAGALRGLACWFGLHGTCVHADNTHLHPDHKGLLAEALESGDVVALCAQECCGDISPNHRPSDRGHTVGPHDDDHESAQFVADAQAAVARRLLAEPGELLTGPIVARTRMVDFAAAPAEGRFVQGGQARTTTPARLGLSMAQGTAEGRGPLFVLGGLLRWAHALRGLWSDDPKIPLLDLGRGASSRVLGIIPLRWVPPVDPVVRWIRDQVRLGTARHEPWVPQVLPVQLLRVGGLAVISVPFECTTVTGRRLRASLARASPDDVVHTVVSPYANAYTGYLTTEQEYRRQHYEAGYTLFGPHTLAALRTVVEDLATGLDAGGLDGEVPPQVDRVHLEALAYQTPWPVPKGREVA